ncbi:MAG: rhodanese-like domain-containing protein [Candidatus Aminicenantes bacterium]|nr:rhodanese-like domain-containing protein [Candidatus Aminicenantes bacterium]
MTRLIRGVLVIIVLSIVLGAGVNFSLLRRFLAGEFRQGFIDEREYAGIRFITLAEAEDLFARKIQTGEGAVFVDSRSRQDFAAGHIPGALNLPVGELKNEKKMPSGGSLSTALSFPEDQLLVVYCEGGDCQTSVSLAKLIHERGFMDIRILSGGWAEWVSAGLPEEGSP